MMGSNLVEGDTCSMMRSDCGTHVPGDVQELRDEIMAKWIELKKSLTANSKWELIESRVRRDQLFRRFQKEKEERMMQDCICKAEKDKCHRERQIIQEENFAEAMKELKEDEVRDSAFQKQLYACAPEIRDLERELRRAYYAKTLHAQRLEQDARMFEEKMHQREMYELLKEKMANYDELEAEKKRQREQMKCDYREELNHQLTNLASVVVKQKEETERDKAMVDEILKTIEQEEINDLIEKTNKVKLYQSEIKNFLEARENQREREKARQKNEEERDAEYLKKKEEQKAALEKAKVVQKTAKAGKTIEQMMRQQFEAEEIEELRRELYEEEMVENTRRKDAEEQEKKCRIMAELREAEAEAKRERAEKLIAEKEEEEKYREQILAKFAEDDRLEQMGVTKRRQRQREHRMKVEEMIMERRALRAQEVEKELHLRGCFEQEEKRRQDLIDLERQKLLKEHGPKLIGFIPRGTIKSQEELEKLGEPFLTYYRNGAEFREPDPTTIDFSECEKELFNNMEVPKYAKY